MTTRIVTDANGRKHITNEPLLHPPQRTWVGLTDDELFKIWMGAPSETEDRFAFVKAVIAKLKEKNT
jgi:hypothetical protein